MKTFRSKYLRKQIYLPQDHGSWVFILMPLFIGFFAGNKISTPAIYLIIAAMAAFFIRQPVTVAVKAHSGRRPRTDLPAARFWMLVFGFIALLMLIGLTLRGFINILYLSIPGFAIFGWHLYLVSKRDERKQAGLEVIASGALALAAPAALWVSNGSYNAQGWILWLLVWFQSAASIIHAYMRLEHRKQAQIPERAEKIQLGKRALLYTSFNFVASLLLGILGLLPRFIFIPFLLQLGETVWWAFNPAIKAKPTSVGFRQLAASTLFTILFIIFWSV
jgi:4-hydroxybenzoate polyprenyltransferase